MLLAMVAWLFATAAVADDATSEPASKYTISSTDETTLPFTVSTDEAQVWYTVKFRNDDSKYLVHKAKTDNDIATDVAFSNIGSSDIATLEGALWAFYSTTNGYKIKCMQTGTYVKVESGNNGVRATLDTDGSEFTVETNTSNNGAGFSFKVYDVDKAFIGDHSDSHLGVWQDSWADTQNDGGSCWIISEVNMESDVYKTPKSYYADGIKDITASDDNDTYLSITKASQEEAKKLANTTYTSLKDGLDALEKIIDLAYTPKPEAGAYYRIVNCSTDCENKYMSTESISVGSDGTLATAYNADNSINRTVSRTSNSDAYLPAVWQLDAQSDDTYLVRNANNNACLGSDASNGVEMPTNDEWAGHFTLAAVPTTVLSTSDMKTKFQLKVNSTLLSVNSDDTENKVKAGSSEADLGCYWQFEKVTSVPVTISSANYATVCHPFAVKVAEGSDVKAYYAKQVEDGTMTLEEFAGGIIPAKTGAVLYHDGATTANLTLTTEEATTVDNKLQGATARRTGYTTEQTYLLALNSSNKAAFCLSTLTVIPANKAYLNASDATNTAAGTKSINFGFESTDGISLAPTAEQQRTTYFDLNGRAVPYPVHGIFVTDKGKKVLIP